MRWYNDPKIVSKTPLVTTVLLVWGNIGQLYQMWHEQTAAGQSLPGWITNKPFLFHAKEAHSL